MHERRLAFLLVIAVSGSSCASNRASNAASFDVLLRGGPVVDGDGGEPFVADVGLRSDEIAAVV